MAEHDQSSERRSPFRPRFSIRTLLLVTTGVAALFPAAWFAWFLLLNASTQWASFAFWLTASILAGGLLIAFNRSGAKQSYWAGFAVVGFVYFLLVPCQIVENQLGRAPFDSDQLLTARLGREVYARYVLPRIPKVPITSLMAAGGGAPGGFAPSMLPPTTLGFGGTTQTFSIGPNQPEQDDFVNVVHLLWTVLFAFCGGWISLALWATGPKARRQGSIDDQRAK